MKNALYLNLGGSNSMEFGNERYSNTYDEMIKEINQFVKNNDISDIVVNNETFDFSKKLNEKGNFDSAALLVAETATYDIDDVNIHSFSTLSDEYGPMPSANLRAATKLHMLTEDNKSNRYMYSNNTFTNVSDKSLDHLVKRLGNLTDITDDKSIIKAHDKFTRYKDYKNEYMDKTPETGDFKYISEYENKPITEKSQITDLGYAPYIGNNRMVNVLTEKIEDIEFDQSSYQSKEEISNDPYQIESLIEKELKAEEMGEELPSTMRPELEQKVAEMDELVGVIAVLEALERDEKRQKKLTEKGQTLTLEDQRSLPDKVKETLEDRGFGAKETRQAQNKLTIKQAESEEMEQVNHDYEMGF